MALSVAALIDAAGQHFPWKPYREVRLPDASRSGAQPGKIVTVDAVFTADGARPRWDNIGLVVHRVSSSDDSLTLWQDRFAADLPAAAALLADNDNAYLLLAAPGGPARLVPLPPGELLPIELSSHAACFAPRDLAGYRRGQLSFADTASHMSSGTLAFASRHRTELHEALKLAIAGAIAELPRHRHQMREPVFRFALAYLGARVLEDKGFFERQGRSATLIDDPRKLLQRTITKANGFFRKAYTEALPQLEEYPRALEALAAHLGTSTTFALIDHHDIGRLYELLIDALRNDEIKEAGPKIRGIADLQQHYTPMALTEQILAHLPLERIRPEHRIIFDPTAGSGTFLLAATQRLAAMTDLPEDSGDLKAYLENHIAGNDSDPNVKDIASLRYRLVQESERTADLFPCPRSFGDARYQDLTRENLGFRPGVLVANPPYAEKDAQQEAAMFVKHALSWLDDGAQFAFVLPQTFLIQSTHGMGDARRELSRRSRILETWQLPEGVVGLSARQPVCAILGIIGADRCGVSVARAVISRAEVNRVRAEGRLGGSWLSNQDDGGGDWRSALTPPVHLTTNGILLSDVFHVFSGPTRQPGTKPTDQPTGPNAGPHFSFEWVGDRLWADPERRPKDQRWINQWKRSAIESRKILESSKLIVSRSTNRGSMRPFRVCYDDRHHWPNNDHHCIAPREGISTRAPRGWASLTAEQQLFWLAGVLSSTLAVQLILGRRGARKTGKQAWLDLPLPPEVDLEIIRLVRSVIQEEQHDSTATPLSKRQSELDVLVRRSYGDPAVFEIPRTGVDHFNDQLAAARREPSTAIVGQVVEFRQKDGQDQILLHINGVEDEPEAWVPLPFELPGWALDGTPFVATAPQGACTHHDLRENRAALRDLIHPPRAYETFEELEEHIRKLGLE